MSALGLEVAEDGGGGALVVARGGTGTAGEGFPRKQNAYFGSYRRNECVVYRRSVDLESGGGVEGQAQRGTRAWAVSRCWAAVAIMSAHPEGGSRVATKVSWVRSPTVKTKVGDIHGVCLAAWNRRPCVREYVSVWRNQHILVDISKEYELLWWSACIAFFLYVSVGLAMPGALYVTLFLVEAKHIFLFSLLL